MKWLLLGAAICIIAGLAFYAGKLLFLLNQQTKKQDASRLQRVHNIVLSIDTIAMAMSQQQCDLSEGAIRICNLLDALPIDNRPNYSEKFSSIYTFYNQISGFATHEARKALSKAERKSQDKHREDIEAKYENQVLSELEIIRNYCESLTT